MESATGSVTTDGANTATVAGSYTFRPRGPLGLQPLGTDLPQEGARATIHTAGGVKEAGVAEAEAKEAVVEKARVRAKEEKAEKVGKAGKGDTSQIRRKLATIGGQAIVGENGVGSLTLRQSRRIAETSHEPVLVGVARTAISNTPSQEGRRHKDREQWQVRRQMEPPRG